MSNPSIFNDVLGPVMRGPSSSHSAGALRIGRLCLNLMQDEISSAHIEYDPNGSLVTTHTSQGTDMGLYGGFLGWEADDIRLINYKEHIHRSGINIKVSYVSYGATHPNTYKLSLKNGASQHQLTALSTGGGMIRVISIDGATVNMAGDAHVFLVYLSNMNSGLLNWLEQEFEFDEISLCSGDRTFIVLKSASPISDKIMAQIARHPDVLYTRLLKPVMPVLARRKMCLPFTNCEDMLAWNKDRHLELWQLALEYEKERSGQSEAELMAYMKFIVGVMKKAIAIGLGGTEYEDRLLPAQSPNFQSQFNQGKLLESKALNQIIMRVSAMMEAKSSMQTIVAAPTAGSCGAAPGAIFGCSAAIEATEEMELQAMFAAGLIGVFIATGATFSAEEAGCMAECGSASAMAAAALVHLGGGNLSQALGATSMALQNCFGMVCDPIANRVEAPCLGKNVMAASNALSCANMAMAGYQHLIPLDEVIAAMAAVGKALPHELCCTALGGLSITPTAKRLEKQMGHTSDQIATRNFKSC